MKNAEQLDQLAAWPVSIGYFEPGSDNKDAVPVYELRFLFFENGVSRKLFIDYGEFAIRARSRRSPSWSRPAPASSSRARGRLGNHKGEAPTAPVEGGGCGGVTRG